MLPFSEQIHSTICQITILDLEHKLLDPPLAHGLIGQSTFISNDILPSSSARTLTRRMTLDSFSLCFSLFSLLCFSPGKREDSLDRRAQTTIGFLDGQEGS
jgi:hypothetical protein